MSYLLEGLKALIPRPHLWKNPFKKLKPHVDWEFNKNEKKKILILGSGWGGYSFVCIYTIQYTITIQTICNYV